MRTLDDPDMSPEQIVELLDLKPHPEGGHFRETFRDNEGASEAGRRAHATAIYYLLKAGERSRWHRVDAAEIWHWYAGDPLRLSLATSDKEKPTHMVLGPDIVHDERPQHIIPANAWQAAEPMGAWTLVGCTVAPGFEFEHFELKAPDWEPGLGAPDTGQI